MRKLTNGLVSISLLSLLLVVSAGQKVKAQDVAVSYQSFYDNLSPYGQWVSDPQYGNVWVPNEGGDFRPYGSRGHWVMTDYGNTWVSDDPWGWACYHYGRWTYDPYYGWVWVPGYEWAPAWVSWRYGGGYSGWAPLGPGISIGATFNCPDSWWVFVAPQYMYTNDCYSHWRGPSYNNTYIHQTTIINNYYVDNGSHVRYNYGPRRDVIERDTHQPVQVYRVSQSNRPGESSISGNRISVYRPSVNRESASTARPSNVIQAPHQIGRPQAANNVSATHQAPFRQVAQKNNPAANNAGNRNGQVQPAQGGRTPANNQQAGQTRNNNAAPNQAQQHNNAAQPQTPARNQQATQRPQQQQAQQQQAQQQQRQVQQQAQQHQAQQQAQQQQQRQVQQQAQQQQRQVQQQQAQQQQRQVQQQAQQQQRQQQQVQQQQRQVQQQQQQAPRQQMQQQAPRSAPQQAPRPQAAPPREEGGGGRR